MGAILVNGPEQRTNVHNIVRSVIFKYTIIDRLGHHLRVSVLAVEKSRYIRLRVVCMTSNENTRFDKSGITNPLQGCNIALIMSAPEPSISDSTAADPVASDVSNAREAAPATSAVPAVGSRGKRRGKRGKSKAGGTESSNGADSGAGGSGTMSTSTGASSAPDAAAEFGDELAGEDDGKGTRADKEELLQAMFGRKGGSSALKASENTAQALKAAGSDGTMSVEAIKAVIAAGKLEGAGLPPAGSASGAAAGGGGDVRTGGAMPPSGLASILGAAGAASSGGEVHKFWSKQPVPQAEEDVAEGPLDEPKTIEDVPAEPHPLPGKMVEWCVVDPSDDKQMDDLYTLLELNYVEDNDAHFRFNYEKEFLRWVL